MLSLVAKLVRDPVAVAFEAGNNDKIRTMATIRDVMKKTREESNISWIEVDMLLMTQREMNKICTKQYNWFFKTSTEKVLAWIYVHG